MQKTYRTFKELNGKTLRPGDIVRFGDRRLTVANNGTYLHHPEENNEIVFHDIIRKYGSIMTFTSTDDLKALLASSAYGYTERGGNWPECMSGDFEALTRLCLVLYSLLESPRPVQVRIGRKWVTINLKQLLLEKELYEIEVGSYTAKVNPAKKVVEVGCQTIPFQQVAALYKLTVKVSGR